MDIQAYIQSGIVEQYVLGLANAEESTELEQLRAMYPELDKAILDFEITLENAAFENAEQPPAFIKTALEKQLFPVVQMAAVNEDVHADTAKVYNTNSWKYLAAACIILLIGSTALNFYFYSGYKDSKAQYEALLSQNNTLQANNASYQQSLQMFQDSSMKQILMTPMPGRENNFATILWDKRTKAVYISAAKMQQAPEGMQYQLWAIVDGKPVNAGMIDSGCTGPGVCKIATIEHAEAFAITLEKAGGSPTPTLSEMYVFGKV